MGKNIKIDGAFVKDTLGEIKISLREILTRIEAGASDSAAAGSSDVQPQDAGGDVQANGESSQQLEAASGSAAQPAKDEEIANLKRKEAELHDQLAEAQRGQQEKDGEIERLKAEEATACQQLEEAKRGQQEQETEIANLKAQEATARQQLVEAQREQEVNETEIGCLKGENEQLSRQLAEVASSNQIEDLIWPAFMKAQETAEDKKHLNDELYADTASPLAIRLVADLFSYNANYKLNSDKKKDLFSSVYRLGESLYAWLSELHSDNDEVCESGERWAELINKENNNTFTIEAPITGCPFDHKTMVNYGSGSSAADVGSVHSWCVKDAEGRTKHLAEVTLT